jgi:WD repeat-containing protein 19
LRVGNITQGVQIAVDLGDTDLHLECAKILEDMKQWARAAQLYEASGMLEKAAKIFIAAKSFSQASRLIARVSDPRLLVQYARACESEKRFEEAAQVYETGGDIPAATRLYLDKLNSPERALNVVREHKDKAGAVLAARYCRNRQDYVSAIEFSLLAGQVEAALTIAQAHGVMDDFARLLGTDASAAQYPQVAEHYERAGEVRFAGRMYARAGQNRRAVELLLRGADEDVEEAIEVVGKARSPDLTVLVADFLFGETDGKPKDKRFLFKLYLALGEFAKAGRIATQVATAAQEKGNYREAHTILFNTVNQLRAVKAVVPMEVDRQLELVHSYVIGRELVQLGEHGLAARMLARVGKSISKFPAHAVGILTSAVVECHRAHMRQSSLEFASILMRPEHRGSIDARYKRKIEALVRKPDRTEDAEDAESPCPFCSQALHDSVLDCPNCKNHVPYCLATGRHVATTDYCECPGCHFPARFSALHSLVSNAAEAEQTLGCYMCGRELGVRDLIRLDSGKARARIGSST